VDGSYSAMISDRALLVESRRPCEHFDLLTSGLGRPNECALVRSEVRARLTTPQHHDI